MTTPAFLRAQARDIAEPRPEPRDPAIQAVIDRLIAEAEAMEAAELAESKARTAADIARSAVRNGGGGLIDHAEVPPASIPAPTPSNPVHDEFEPHPAPVVVPDAPQVTPAEAPAPQVTLADLMRELASLRDDVAAMHSAVHAINASCLP